MYRARSSAVSEIPQDAFARWSALQAWSTDASNRLDEQVDLAFWQRVAAAYDRETLPARVPAVLDRVRALVRPGASLLDVGTGTGAFALPLAGLASRVTALDYSAAMLDVLKEKLARLPARHNVQPVLARWEDAVVGPHAVVLAANALYRTGDLRLALRKMIDLARERGIIVWSVGRQDSPQQLLRDRVDPRRYRPGPDYVHVLDGLYHLDVFAQVDMVDVDDTQWYSTDVEAAEGLLSWSPISAEDQRRLSSLLPPLLERTGEGWRWRRRGRIAVIWWDGPDAPGGTPCDQ